MNKVINIATLIFSIFIIVQENSYSQIKGEKPSEPSKDTIYVFDSPHPLIDEIAISEKFRKFLGLDVILSNSGFAFGVHYQVILEEDLFLFANIFASGARNTDEFDIYDPVRNRYLVPNKVNRLFMFPLTFGVNKYILSNVLSESLKPYLTAGIGPTTIIATPYQDVEFFSSFGQARFFIRFGGFLGLGANFAGSTERSMLGVSLKYYFIPFGGYGLESIRDNPIKDFGGVFISLTLGTKL